MQCCKDWLKEFSEWSDVSVGISLEVLTTYFWSWAEVAHITKFVEN